MNSIVQNYLPIFREYQAIRNQLMDVLIDTDLHFSLGGETLTLGALCRELGEVEYAYGESFKTFKLDFGYQNTNPQMETSVASLKAWYAELDSALEATITALTDHDIANRLIDRGPGFQLPLQINLDVYKEALLIFYGKASIYLRALGKARPKQIMEWIA